MRISKTLGIGVAVVTLLTLAACGKSSTSNKNRALNTTAQQNVETVDPNRATDVGSDEAITETLEGLYKQNNNGKIVPSIATKVVQPTDNGKVYTFNLRKDAKWNDGTQVTAQDFVASFQRQVNPKTKSQRVSHLKDFAGFQKVSTGKAPVSDLGVKALSKYKVRITLSHAVPYFNDLLATELYPINRKDVQKWGAKYGEDSQHAASDGAYQIKNWNSSKDTWNLDANKNYYNADKVHIKKVNFQVVKTPQTGLRLFQSKKLDETQLSGSMVASAKKQFKNELVISKFGEMAFIPWNNYKKTTRNLDLRRAVSYSINRDVLAKNVLKDGSTAAQSVVPVGEVKGSNGKDFNNGISNKLSYNPTKAKYYFKKAQQELGTKKISVQFLTADTDAYKAVGEYIQGQAQKELPGLTITLRSIPLEQEVADFSNHNFQAGTLGWSTDYPDPIDYLNLASPEGDIDFTNWKNAKYQALLNKINDTANQKPAERVKLQQQAAEMLNNLQGVTPLYQYASVHLRSKDLKGLNYPLVGYAKYEYASWK
ncbi:peptide ABC transporter substrate-binding protein [Secundilactobacillus folii]|uniref:Peptide ABC transporter substrate-binding protein n=1 Tax=Secundilactobacillus folii TaxID=2678357 RepID=A0A7X2XWZ5_9LACO|nr:peptide ABC transporter substrate-binding protein [Secundilactobacillus folii]MTV83133.1 peptide ABC transporter substrate-binding protein [Secundilactobacillus folii]